MVEFVMLPRNEAIGRLVEDCARGLITFDVLCQQVRAMGYNGNSLYEMVIAKECEIKRQEKE